MSNNIVKFEEMVLTFNLKSFEESFNELKGKEERAWI